VLIAPGAGAINNGPVSGPQVGAAPAPEPPGPVLHRLADSPRADAQRKSATRSGKWPM